MFRPGVINVYDKASGAALIRVQSDELVLGTDPKTGKVKTNVHELPYGEQSVLIYQDFNFDGIKDLALMDGKTAAITAPRIRSFSARPMVFGTAIRLPNWRKTTAACSAWMRKPARSRP